MRAILEIAQGAIDGSNTTFSTSIRYERKSTVVYLNGIALVANKENGWTETGSMTFQMKLAPTLGDSVQVYYRPVVAL